MGSYPCKNLVLVYRAIDILDDLNHYTHAVNIKYVNKEKAWILKDSNQSDMLPLKSYSTIRNWLAPIYEIRILSFDCVQSSTDPNAKYHERTSFNSIREDLGQAPVKSNTTDHVTVRLKDLYPKYHTLQPISAASDLTY